MTFTPNRDLPNQGEMWMHFKGLSERDSKGYVQYLDESLDRFVHYEILGITTPGKFQPTAHFWTRNCRYAVTHKPALLMIEQGLWLEEVVDQPFVVFSSTHPLSDVWVASLDWFMAEHPTSPWGYRFKKVANNEAELRL